MSKIREMDSHPEYPTDKHLYEAGYTCIGHYAEIMEDDRFERLWLWIHEDTEEEVLAYDGGSGNINGIMGIDYITPWLRKGDVVDIN